MERFLKMFSGSITVLPVSNWPILSLGSATGSFSTFRSVRSPGSDWMWTNGLATCGSVQKHNGEKTLSSHQYLTKEQNGQDRNINVNIFSKYTHFYSHIIFYKLPASKDWATHWGCFSAIQTAFSIFSQSLSDMKCLGKVHYILFTLSWYIPLLWAVFSLILKSTWKLHWPYLVSL